MSERFIIEGLGGARTLKGAVAVRGAKNAVLKSMAATVLFKGPLTLTNVPDIEDVGCLGDILLDLGAEVTKGDGSYTIDTDHISKSDIDEALAKRLRASIVLSGPLLARFGRTSFPHPGGDIIGPRPINFFLEGFQKMGATVEQEGNRYVVTAPGGKLKGAEIFFIYVSVTATESLLMAAILAEGTTVLRNAAMEPEIVELANFLNKCGAKITGAGSPTITIEGGGMLTAPSNWETMPDRIEAGSFLLLGALAAEHLEITNCDPSHLEMLIELLRESGVVIDTTKSSIILRKVDARKFHALQVRTHEYPGFATDLQPPMVVYLTQSYGESSMFETIWGGRLAYTQTLAGMGAKINLLNTQQIKITGPTPLTATNLESPDIRAGLAFLMSAAIATGTSTVGNIFHIDRGYERIEERLQKIGLNIKREVVQ